MVDWFIRQMAITRKRMAQMAFTTKLTLGI